MGGFFSQVVRLVAGAAVIAVPSAAWAQTIPLPGNDPFYKPPANIGALNDGSVIRERDVALALSSSVLPGLESALNVSIPDIKAAAALAEANGFNTYQLLYKSTDGSGNAVAEAATVLVPRQAWTGPGSRPLISYQVAEDSASVNCQPSYVLRAGLLAQGGGSGSGSLEGLTALAALNLGYALVYPDYEGPQSEWLAGPQAGYAALDAIRATLSYKRDGLSRHTKVGLWGYSGGGGATAWVAALKGRYAPELNVVGAAIGSASNSDLAKAFTNLDGGLLDGFIFTGIVGLQRATPGADLTPYLTAQGQQLIASAADPNKCLVQELATFAGAGKVEQYTTMPSTPLIDLPPAKQILPANSLVGQPTLAPVMPVLNYQDNFDEVVPVGNDNEMAIQWCKSHVNVEIERFTTPLPAVALIHVVGAIEGLFPALTYLTDRFNGLPPRNDCRAAPLWSTSILPYYPGIVQ